MNEAFRDYAFGRSFNVSLSEKHVETLRLLCTGDELAALGIAQQMHGLVRRGLVAMEFDDLGRQRWRATRAGMLVHDLLVEAGECAALDEKRRLTLEKEHELHKLEWDERFGNIEIKLKDRYRRAPLTGAQS